MANGVTIIIAGKDESGAVFDAVQAHLDKTAASAARATAANAEFAASEDEAAGSGMRLQTQLGLVDNAMRGQTSRALADIIRSMSKFGIVMDLLPVAAAVAGLAILGKMLFEVGKQFGVGGNEAVQLNNKLLDFNDSLASTNAGLKLTLDKELQAKAISDGKPFDGLRISADEAAVAVGKLQEQLNGVVDKELDLIKGKEFTGGWLQQMFGIKGGTDYEQTLLLEHQKYLLQATSSQGELAESKSYGAALQARARELEFRTGKGAGGESPAVLPDLKSELKAVEQMIAWQQSEEKRIELEVQVAANKPPAHGRTRRGAAGSLELGGPQSFAPGANDPFGQFEWNHSQVQAYLDQHAQYAADDANRNSIANKELSGRALQGLTGNDAQMQAAITQAFKTAAPSVVMGTDKGSDLAAIQGAAEKYAHAIFDPLFNLSESWEKRWKDMKASLLRSLGQSAESQLFGVLFGDPTGRGGKGWNGMSFKGDTSNPTAGRTGLASEALGGLLGLFHRRTGLTSNGGKGGGAGTIATAAASVMQMGNAGAATGGVQVVLNNNGAPLAVSGAQKQNDGGEGQVIQIMLKQMETNGPVAQAIMGAVGAL